LIWSGNGDGNANTCVGAYGATTVRTGSFLAFGKNHIDLSCDGYAKGFAGLGTVPFSTAFQEASGKGNCLFTVTMGSDAPRQTISTLGHCSPACASGMACRNARCVLPVAPSAPRAWTFHADQFWSMINSSLAPMSVGYQAS